MEETVLGSGEVGDVRKESCGGEAENLAVAQAFALNPIGLAIPPGQPPQHHLHQSMNSYHPDFNQFSYELLRIALQFNAFA